MGNPIYRIKLASVGRTLPASTVFVGLPMDAGPLYSDSLYAKDFSLTDDMMKACDSASFSVANRDGEHTGKFVVGQRVEIDAREPGVAGGQWTRQYTGIVTRLNNSSRFGSGTVLRVDCMDIGWFLTTCCAQPLLTTNGVTLAKLISNLISAETTWNFASTTATIGNALSKRLKQGRAGVLRAQPRNPLQVLPPIQVEPGQTPWAVLEEYCKRAGFLLNVGAMGDLILFQPDYTQASHYAPIEFHGSSEGQRAKNNILDASLDQSIDGVVSEAQCWSTVVVPTPDDQANIALSPNAQYRSTRVINGADTPFNRRMIVVDSEAINEQMRRNRALWAMQIAQFNGWTYSCTVHGHSSALSENAGVFWTSDTLVSVDDSINQIDEMLYVQSVNKTYTEDGGARTKLVLRKNGVLNPALLAQV